MRTPVEVNPDWFLLFSITSSSNTLEGHQRHLNLFIGYVNGYLLWWSPESWKLLPSATLHTSCVLDQCFWMCGPWISNISMNWKLVRNALLSSIPNLPETLGVECSYLCFYKPSKWVWCKVKIWAPQGSGTFFRRSFHLGLNQLPGNLKGDRQSASEM